MAVPLAIAVAAAAASAGVGALLAPKPAKLPQAVPAPTRNQALSQTLNSDATFRKRQGAAATVLNGPNGAEAPSPGVKSLLGQ